MSPHEVVVTGRVRGDGTLELDRKVPLPPGPVQVTVQAMASPSAGQQTWSVLERIWAERQARGVRSRRREEIDAELDGLREESEQEFREIERMHESDRGGQR